MADRDIGDLGETFAETLRDRHQATALRRSRLRAIGNVFRFISTVACTVLALALAAMVADGEWIAAAIVSPAMAACAWFTIDAWKDRP